MVLTEAGTVEQELLLPACGNHVTSQGIQQRSAHQAGRNGAIQFSYQEKWCYTVFLDLCSFHFRIKQPFWYHTESCGPLIDPELVRK